MGGIGSGAWYRWDKRDTVEDCLSLDVRALARRDLLRPGLSFSWQWSRDGKSVGRIGIHSFGYAVRLDYKTRGRGEQDWIPHDIHVPLSWSRCHYGGSRPWFDCPTCGRRVAKLYSHGGLFACRHCHGLPYASQEEARHDRAARRMWKLRRRLGAIDGEVLFKPKGMHWRTFERLVALEQSAAEEVDAHTIELMQRLTSCRLG